MRSNIHSVRGPGINTMKSLSSVSSVTPEQEMKAYRARRESVSLHFLTSAEGADVRGAGSLRV